MFLTSILENIFSSKEPTSTPIEFLSEFHSIPNNPTLLDSPEVQALLGPKIQRMKDSNDFSIPMSEEDYKQASFNSYIRNHCARVLSAIKEDDPEKAISNMEKIIHIFTLVEGGYICPLHQATPAKLIQYLETKSSVELEKLRSNFQKST